MLKIHGPDNWVKFLEKNLDKYKEENIAAICINAGDDMDAKKALIEKYLSEGMEVIVYSMTTKITLGEKIGKETIDRCTFAQGPGQSVIGTLEDRALQ